MVHIPGDGKVDLSIIGSLHCNLRCSFCMYDAGPSNGRELDRNILNAFLRTVDWDTINSVGFYGGEISTNLKVWGSCISKVDLHAPKKWNGHKWCITNGSWSKHHPDFYSFINFANNKDLRVFISTTEEHRAHQDPEKLRILVESSDRFKFKKDDLKSKLLPMGRNKQELWTCSKRCLRLERHRMAILPNGDVIYQKCDGIYPVIANITSEEITWAKITYMLNNQFRCSYLNEDMGAISWEMRAEAMEIP